MSKILAATLALAIAATASLGAAPAQAGNGGKAALVAGLVGGAILGAVLESRAREAGARRIYIEADEAPRFVKRPAFVERKPAQSCRTVEVEDEDGETILRRICR